MFGECDPGKIIEISDNKITLNFPPAFAQTIAMIGMKVPNKLRPFF
jgi:hypothetical protein